jgi:hypothetical protein
VDSTNDIFDADLRFHEVTICTELDTTLALVFTGKRGHHNNFYIFCLGSRAQDIQHIKTTNLWHHDIADDQPWLFFDSHGKGFFPVASRNNVVALR